MSLVSLTFGGEKRYNVSPHIAISTPAGRIEEKIARGGEGRALVKKACRFYGQENVYIVAEVIEGLLGEGMKAFLEDRQLRVVEIESKYGSSAKKGMTVGIMLSGASEEELSGKTLRFSSS